MASLTLTDIKVKPLTYDIVEEKWRSARILVYLEGYVEEITIRTNKNKLYIIIVDRNSYQTYTFIIRLWFRIKNVDYRVKNGVMTIDVDGKRFLFI